MTTPRLAIRCCCQPSLVLGTVPVERSLITRGMSVGFHLHRTCRIVDLGETADLSPDRVLRLPIEDVHGTGGHELAIKSNDTPLDTLRLIPGFREINRVIPVGEVVA